MRRITSTLATAATAVFLAGSVASAGLIADYRIHPGSHGSTPGQNDIIDIVGPEFSNSTARINGPVRWIGSAEAPPVVPNNPDLGAPAGGLALRMRQTQGYRLADGGGTGELFTALQEGPFSVFARVFKRADVTQTAPFAILRNTGTMDFTLETSTVEGNVIVSLAGYAVVDGTSHVTRAPATDLLDQWMDVAMTVEPGESVRIFINGEQVGAADLPDGPLSIISANSIQFRNDATTLTGSSQNEIFMESLRIYDHALSGVEVAALSAVPEPAVLGLAGPAVMLLLSRRRRK